MKTLGERLKSLRGGASQAVFAKRLGIPQTTLSNYESGRNKPDFELIDKVCSLFGVNVEWLLFGRGIAKRDKSAEGFLADGIYRGREPLEIVAGLDSRLVIPETGSEANRSVSAADGVAGNHPWFSPVRIEAPPTDNPWKSAAWHDAPVLALGNCGETDWYSPNRMALRARLPVEYPYTPNLFAVIAVGMSMQPEGIKQGYVLFCDPNSAIEPGDVVFVERADGIVTIKKFLKRDTQAVHLQGWEKPEANGLQAPYFVEIDNSQVTRLVCIVVVKRKG